LDYNTFVHGSNAKNISVWLSLTNKNALLCLSYYAYVFSSTKLERRAEQVLPGSRGVGGKREEHRAGGRNDPNNVCTFE
jgi:hypothetical protein